MLAAEGPSLRAAAGRALPPALAWRPLAPATPPPRRVPCARPPVCRARASPCGPPCSAADRSCVLHSPCRRQERQILRRAFQAAACLLFFSGRRWTRPPDHAQPQAAGSCRHMPCNAEGAVGLARPAGRPGYSCRCRRRQAPDLDAAGTLRRHGSPIDSLPRSRQSAASSLRCAADRRLDPQAGSVHAQNAGGPARCIGRRAAALPAAFGSSLGPAPPRLPR